MACYYSDFGSASDWSCRERNFLQRAIPRCVQCHVISMEFPQSFLRRHFAGKSVADSRNVGFFMACFQIVRQKLPSSVTDVATAVLLNYQKHFCKRYRSYRQVVFSFKNEEVNTKTTSANIPFSTSLPFFPFAFSSFPFLCFVSVIFGQSGNKNPALLAPFYSNGCKFLQVRFQKSGLIEGYTAYCILCHKNYSFS